MRRPERNKITNKRIQPRKHRGKFHENAIVTVMEKRISELQM